MSSEKTFGNQMMGSQMSLIVVAARFPVLIGLILTASLWSIQSVVAQPSAVIADFEETLQPGQVQICGGGMNWGRVQDVPAVYGGDYALTVEFVNICGDCPEPEVGGLLLSLDQALPLGEHDYVNFFIKPDDARPFTIQIISTEGVRYETSVEDLVPLEWQQVSIEASRFERSEDEDSTGLNPRDVQALCFSSLLHEFGVFGFIIDFVAVTRGVALSTGEFPQDGWTIEAAVFPNPQGSSESRSTLFLNMPAPADFEVVLYDILGRQVGAAFVGWSAGGQDSIAMPWSGLTPGTYILQVRTMQGVRNTKFVVSR